MRPRCLLHALDVYLPVQLLALGLPQHSLLESVESPAELMQLLERQVPRCRGVAKIGLRPGPPRVSRKSFGYVRMSHGQGRTAAVPSCAGAAGQGGATSGPTRLGQGGVDLIGAALAAARDDWPASFDMAHAGLEVVDLTFRGCRWFVKLVGVWLCHAG